MDDLNAASLDDIIIVTVKPGVAPADVEREMDQVLQQFLKEGPTADELARAKTRRLAAVARVNERRGHRAKLLSENATFGATPEQVRRAGAAWLNACSHTLTVKPFAPLAGENRR